jgi:hypothetical protein
MFQSYALSWEHEVSIDRNDIQDMSFITIWSDTSTCSKDRSLINNRGKPIYIFKYNSVNPKSINKVKFSSNEELASMKVLCTLNVRKSPEIFKVLAGLLKMPMFYM